MLVYTYKCVFVRTSIILTKEVQLFIDKTLFSGLA